MKKSVRKIIRYLSRYIGMEIIRTKPACGDWSYTSNKILLHGFTSKGQIKFEYTGMEALAFGHKQYIMPIQFTDRNWVTAKKALRSKHNALNKWKGRKIFRICPPKGCCDNSFVGENKAATIVSASRHHVLIVLDNFITHEATNVLLDYRFAKVEDWRPVE